jgi:hypothetical protein
MSDKGFLEEERSKLEKIRDSLNPEEAEIFDNQIDALEGLLKVLEKSDGKLSKKDKKSITEQYQNLANMIRLSTVGGGITHKELTQEERIKAKLVRGNKVLMDNSDLPIEDALAKVQQFYDQKLDNTEDTSHFAVDYELSSMHPEGHQRFVVARNMKTGDIEVNVAGTKLGIDNHALNDIGMDVDIMRGENVKDHAQIQDGRDVINAIREKFPNAKIELNGYSLGGHKIIQLGNEFRLKATAFNPHTLSKYLSDIQPPAGVTHKIIRTKRDIPSLLSKSLEARHPNGYEVKVIPELKQNDMSFNWRDPKSWLGFDKSHRMDNFYLKGERVGEDDELVDAQEDIIENMGKVRDYHRLNEMIKAQPKRPKITIPERGHDITDLNPEWGQRASSSLDITTLNPEWRLRQGDREHAPPPPEAGAEWGMGYVGDYDPEVERGRASRTPATSLIRGSNQPEVRREEIGMRGEIKPPPARKRYIPRGRLKEGKTKQQIIAESTAMQMPEPSDFQHFRQRGSGGITKRKDFTLGDETFDERMMMKEMDMDTPLEEHANARRMSMDDHIKYLWKQAGGSLTDKEASIYDEHIAKQNVSLTPRQIDMFKDLDDDQRNEIIETEMDKASGKMRALDDASSIELAGVGDRLVQSRAFGTMGENFKSAFKGAFSRETAGGIGLGIATGWASDKLLSMVDKKHKTLGTAGDSLASAAISGAGANALMGGGMAAGSLMGLGASIAGMGAEYGTDALLGGMGMKAGLGRTEISDIMGGVVGGGTAVTSAGALEGGIISTAATTATTAAEVGEGAEAAGIGAAALEGGEVGEAIDPAGGALVGAAIGGVIGGLSALF